MQYVESPVEFFLLIISQFTAIFILNLFGCDCLTEPPQRVERRKDLRPLARIHGRVPKAEKIKPLVLGLPPTKNICVLEICRYGHVT